MRRLYGILPVIIGLCIFGCNTVQEEETATGPTDPNGTEFQSVTIAGVTFEYKTADDSLHCKLRAQTSGWISAGFNPTSAMRDANIIIGYISEGIVYMRDDWGTGRTQHQSDQSLGGDEDIRIIAGVETASDTEIEFKIPLDSGDGYDRTLQIGQSYPLILAQGAADSFSGMHSQRGTSTITL